MERRALEKQAEAEGKISEGGGGIMDKLSNSITGFFNWGNLKRYLQYKTVIYNKMIE